MLQFEFRPVEDDEVPRGQAKHMAAPAAGAKNPAGYFKVIVPPMGIAVVRMNPTVTDTNVRQAIRSDDCISNDTAETCPTIEPEDTASEAVGSVDV